MCYVDAKKVGGGGGGGISSRRRGINNDIINKLKEMHLLDISSVVDVLLLRSVLLLCYLAWPPFSRTTYNKGCEILCQRP